MAVRRKMAAVLFVSIVNNGYLYNIIKHYKSNQ
nr:MAG TPA: hypothetical protein [Caudoviricetes sp.]